MLQFYLMKNIGDNSNIYFTVITFSIFLSTSLIYTLHNIVFLEFSSAVQTLISVLLLKEMIIAHSVSVILHENYMADLTLSCCSWCIGLMQSFSAVEQWAFLTVLRKVCEFLPYQASLLGYKTPSLILQSEKGSWSYSVFFQVWCEA